MKELGSEARRLLDRLGDADGPSSAQTTRMKQKLAAALGGVGVLGAAGIATAAGASSGASGMTAGAALATTKATSLAGLLSTFLIGAAAGVGVSTSGAWVRHLTTPAPSARIHASATAADRVSAAAPPEATGRDAPPAEIPEEAPTRVPPAAFAPKARGPVPTAAPAPLEATLGPELELVIRAQRELSLGDARRALGTVEELEAEFPHGSLREERMLLQVLALCASGERERARVEARALVTSARSSPLLPRLEQSCAGDETREKARANGR